MISGISISLKSDVPEQIGNDTGNIVRSDIVEHFIFQDIIISNMVGIWAT